MSRLNCAILVYCLAVVAVFTGVACQSSVDSTTWKQLEQGLELGVFDVTVSPKTKAQFVALRVNPKHWKLELRSRSQSGADNDKSAKQWCQEPGVVAATNAGMFNTDYSAHIGYMQSGEHLNNPRILRKTYRSAALFGPLFDTLPEFQIVDLDETELDSLKNKYQYVVQNLRLIKYPGENRWEKQDKKWSEMALAEDSAGNALFVFSGEPLTMHVFNEVLLSLPLNVIRAQHLEGGPEAQLFYDVGNHKEEFVGSFKTGFSGNANYSGWPIPNVIVVKRR